MTPHTAALQLLDDAEVIAVCATAFDVLRAQMLDAGFQPQPKEKQQELADGFVELRYVCQVEQGPGDETFEVRLTLRVFVSGKAILCLDAIRFNNDLASDTSLAHQMLCSTISCEDAASFTALKTSLGDSQFYADCEGTPAPGLRFFSPHLWIQLLPPTLLSALQP